MNTTRTARNCGGDALPSEWRPLLRSDRLLGSPGADRQSFGGSPAIEGISIQYPPKHARFSAQKRQAPIIHPGDQIGRARGRQLSNERKACPNDTYDQRCRGMPFPRNKSGWAGRTSYLRKAAAADKGVVKRGHACAQSRRTYSSTGPPAGSTSGSAERDRATKRSRKNESVVVRSWRPPFVTAASGSDQLCERPW
jgi:hypothetical protein